MLARVVDIIAWLHADRTTPVDDRHARDRGVAKAAALPENPLLRVLAWWQRIDVRGDSAPRRDDRLPGGDLVAARTAATALVCVAGLVLGLAACAGALAYDGSRPVNILAFLGALVGLPLVLLLLSLVLLPERVGWFRPLQSLVSGLSVGQWASVWVRRRAAGDTLFGWLSRARSRRYAKWQALLWSQCFGVAFFVGCLTSLLVLVAVSDVAFGWSSTLDLDPARLAGWVRAVSAPWRELVPNAAPDAELVAQSRFFRLDAVRDVDAAVWGGWWPFVAMVLLVYGLLPRLVMLLFAVVGVRGATRKLLLDDSEVALLLARLDTPLVDSGASAPGTARDTDQPDGVARGASGMDQARHVLVPDGSLVVVVWNDAVASDMVDDWCARHLPGRRVEQVVYMSHYEPEQQPAVCVQRIPRDAQAIAVLTKGWEPPVLELIDGLRLIGERTQATQFVVPLNVEGGHVAGADRLVWQRRLTALDDPTILLAEVV